MSERLKEIDRLRLHLHDEDMFPAPDLADLDVIVDEYEKLDNRVWFLEKTNDRLVQRDAEMDEGAGVLFDRIKELESALRQIASDWMQIGVCNTLLDHCRVELERRRKIAAAALKTGSTGETG